jgi:crotonobetaine/carnitine-CoA ligase
MTGALSAAAFWSARCRHTPDARFLRSEGSRWTYAEFDRWSGELTRDLRAAGIGPDDRLAVILPNTPTHLRLLVAVFKLGCTAVPINPDSTPQEAGFVLRASGARAVATDPSGWAALGRHLPGANLTWINAEDPGGGLGAGAPGPPAAPVSIAAAAPDGDPLRSLFLMYTSGSSGTPKGVLLPSAGFATTGTAAAGRFGLTGDDRIICVLPLFHAGTTHLQVAAVIAAGAELVLPRRFSARRFWDQVRQAGATHAVLPSVITSILMTAPPRTSDAGSGLRRIATDRWPAGFCRRFGVEALPIWAMTELSAMGTMTPPGRGDCPAGLIGRPLPADAQLEVRRADGSTAAAGETGEIWFWHPHVMLGYDGDPQATATVLVDGWVRTGDLGHLDRDGWVYFDGRLKNIIKRSGENISAEEVESALRAHPAVRDCLVLGVPDPIRTEEALALVVLVPGGSLAAAEVQDWCRTQGRPPGRSHDTSGC